MPARHGGQITSTAADVTQMTLSYKAASMVPAYTAASILQPLQQSSAGLTCITNEKHVWNSKHEWNSGQEFEWEHDWN